MKKLLRTSLLLLGLSYCYSFSVLAQWSTHTLSLPRLGMTVASVGNKALFAGGYYYPFLSREVDQVDIYDGVTNQWTTAKLATSRQAITAITVGNLAFFAGGKNVPISVYSTSSYDGVDIYNADTDQWTSARLSRSRFDIGVASAAGKVFFGGGTIDYIRGGFAGIDVYDIATNKWSVMQLPRLGGALGAVSVNNKVLFYTKPGSSYQLSSVDIYDTTTDQWVLANLSSVRYNVAVTSIGNKVFFAGGGGNNDANPGVDIYDATTNQWSTAQLSQARTNITAISVGNKAFFAGGTGNSSVVDIYDATTNQWTTAQLSKGRSGIAATSAGSKVFFAGDNTGSLVVDMYDTVTNQWSTTQLPRAKASLLAIRAGERALFAENDGYPPSGIVDTYTTNAALPVNLISFSGKWTESTGAELSWQTSWETANSHFEIQRSRDAKSFETIGRVQGKGTTSERTNYSFIDPNLPDPVNYYRLRQVDLDGSVHFSKIISVNRQETKQPAQLSVWPSPTTGALTIQLSAGVTAKEVSIYDLHGRKLRSQTASPSTTDVSGLQTGAYILDVLTDDGQHVRSRFIKH